MEVNELGTLRIVNSEVVADEIANVKMTQSGGLSIIKNGRLSEFAEVLDNSRIILKNGKIVKLPGVLYTIDQDVYVRSSPFNSSSNILKSEYYTRTSGRLVIVNDEINGWYEIVLPEHQFGFIPVSTAKIVAAGSAEKKRKEVVKHAGFRNGINYIINRSFKNIPDTQDIVINITYSDGSFDESSSLIVNNIMSARGYRSTPSFFSKFYYMDELGQQLILGNLDCIKKLRLYDYADFLLIGTHSTKIRVNQIKSDMLTADLKYTLNLINLKTGTIEKSLINTIHGNGWTDDQARNNALQAFYKIVKRSEL